jgi:hypothetical protein
VFVRKFQFEKYPKHVKTLLNYAWKFLVIHVRRQTIYLFIYLFIFVYIYSFIYIYLFIHLVIFSHSKYDHSKFYAIQIECIVLAKFSYNALYEVH